MSTPDTFLTQTQQLRILVGLRHLDRDTILAYAQEKVMDLAEQQRIEAHLFDCEECLTEFNAAFDAHSPHKADFDVFHAKLTETPTDDEVISKSIHLLLESPDTNMQQWAIAELRPSAAAGNTQAINALKYTALELWDNEAVREMAAQALEDLGIPLQGDPHRERLSFIESLLGLFHGAKQLAMGFAAMDDRTPIDWTGGQLGSVYRQDGALSLRIVLERGTEGTLAIVSFKGAEADTILKPAIIRQNREGVLFADVSLDGIGKEGIIAPPYIVSDDKFHPLVIRPLLTAAYAQATEADRIIWKQWAESLVSVPTWLEGLVGQMRDF